MEVLRESTAVSDTATSTIPGPYVRPERTESIPLKGVATPSPGYVSRFCRNCLGFADDDAGDGLKYIIATFFILSVAVTIALVSQIYHGDFQVVPHGNVATDSLNCSTIGTDILKKNGNAVDAAVASTLCMGVVNPHITGLGGGGFMLVYDHRRGEILESLDFRESAPHLVSLPAHETVGPLTVGVPGLVSGLYAVHKAYGKLSWGEVVKPSADIARIGFMVPSSLVAARAQLLPRSGINGLLHDFLGTLEAGQILKRPTLATTLELIAENGPDGWYRPIIESFWWKSLTERVLIVTECTVKKASILGGNMELLLHSSFYNGSIGNEILTAIEGSSMTTADLASYRPVQRESLHENFYGFDIIVPGAPSGGPLLLAALKSISSLNLSGSISEESFPLLLYRQTQAIQQNYAVFFAESGDPDFTSVPTPGKVSSVLPDTVASHVAAVDLNDLYVSVVSGHNSLFGSQVMTKGGFLLNNALASFDIPPPEAEKLGTARPILYSNAHSIPNNGRVADSSILPDHPVLPPLDSSHLLPPQEKESSNQTPSLPLPGRRRRFEPGPRATVWGSTVADNVLAGGKRPISLATPIIAIERGHICGRRLVLGGSDAGVAAQVLSQLLVLDGNTTSSIEFPRVRLSPSGPILSIGQTNPLSPSRLQQLADLGIHMQPSVAPNPSINIVEKVGDVLESHSDSRGEGVASRF